VSNANLWNEKQNSGQSHQNHGLDLWQVIILRKWLILFGLLVGAGLGYLYAIKQAPVYETTAQVLVVNERKPVLPMKGIEAEIGYEQNSATHSLLIRSPLIVRRAIEDHQLGALQSFAGKSNLSRVIIDGISVIRADSGGDGSANVLEMKFQGPDPLECAQVLKAVIESYQSFLGETAQNISKETVQLITEAKDSLLTHLREQEAQYRKFRQDAPLLWNKDKGTNIHQARLTQIEAARSELLLAYTQTKAQLLALDDALRNGGNREALRLMVHKVAGDSAARDTDNKSPTGDVFPLLLERQMLLENHGPDHPSVRAIQKRIDLTRSYHQSVAIQRELRDAGTQPTDFLMVYLESLREELKANKQRQNDLDALFQKERKAAKAMADYEVTDETYRNDISRTQQLFEGVVKRLEEVNLIKDYGGYKTQVISPAGIGVQIEPKFERIMAVACILGLLGGLVLGYAAELADKSFRTPEEISDILQLPIVGHIPFIQPDKNLDKSKDSKLQPTLCTFHRPKSRLSEAYRAVRTSLYFSTLGEGYKVIQITSPVQGDGKSTLAANLAISIANSGKRVLLIDADFRRPALHKLFGVEKSVGMAKVIEGKATLPEAIQATEVENLWMIPVGSTPHNPSELLTSPRLGELLDSLRDQYDFVLVDTPPLLAVTDPSAVAARVDGVLVTLRITKKARPNGVRAIGMLNSLGANLIGIVVNGAGGESGYGYGSNLYGGYRYRYSAHGYGYGYGYAERSNGTYYSDEASDQPAPKELSLASQAHR